MVTEPKCPASKKISYSANIATKKTKSHLWMYCTSDPWDKTKNFPLNCCETPTYFSALWSLRCKIIAASLQCISINPQFYCLFSFLVNIFGKHIYSLHITGYSRCHHKYSIHECFFYLKMLYSHIFPALYMLQVC